MSFLDYLKEHRGLYIDHRITTPARPSVAADELDGASAQHAQPAHPGGLIGRRRRARIQPRSVRFRHVRPAFAPSPYSDPLPYEEPWERAFR